MASSSSTVARSRASHALHPDDAMALRAAALSAWARRNARMIIAISVVAIVVVGGLLVWKATQARRNAAAAEALLALRANPAIATAAGAAQLDNFIKNHDGTVEADEARLMRAETQLNAGNPRPAIASLNELANSRSPLAAQAAMMLGSAHAQMGDRNAAIKAYELAADKGELRYQKFEALGQAALQYELAGNYKGAAEAYRKVLAETEPLSQQAAVVEMRITEALARAGTAPR
ncbi:tetratricopeptide repeat protein [Longimicrobium sp.]|uniref:tetratricopeptide repeat protein n=1 Tax=Longimicrobium sp. TaxID=2029185 RepID=UPI002E3687CD|nr:tetratricopeptide repeat protein [Longimicrobium sp.]HEX6039145.1 tetratricopeptide repeat protein [Longimicrobium sp.]